MYVMSEDHIIRSYLAYYYARDPIDGKASLTKFTVVFYSHKAEVLIYMVLLQKKLTIQQTSCSSYQPC